MGGGGRVEANPSLPSGCPLPSLPSPPHLEHLDGLFDERRIDARNAVPVAVNEGDECARHLRLQCGSFEDGRGGEFGSTTARGSLPLHSSPSTAQRRPP